LKRTGANDVLTAASGEVVHPPCPRVQHHRFLPSVHSNSQWDAPSLQSKSSERALDGAVVGDLVTDRGFVQLRPSCAQHQSFLLVVHASRHMLRPNVQL